MTITPTKDLDLISPFPSREVGRLWGWYHCYNTDPQELPSERREISLNPADTTYAMVDKENSLKMGHELPLVGIVSVSPDAALCLSCTRKAFKAGYAEQALRAVIALGGVETVALSRSNLPLLHLLRSVGFVRTARTSSPVLLLKLKR